jgi:transposase
MKKLSSVSAKHVAGLDLGDRMTVCSVCDWDGCNEVRFQVPTTKEGFAQRFAFTEPMRIALEVGTHSPWISRLLKDWSHEVIVANAGDVGLIHSSRKKNDQVDADRLRELARFNPQLLSPIEHRSEQAQTEMALLRARDTMVRVRSGLITSIRGTVKSMGERISCDSESFGRKAVGQIPALLEPALEPMLETIRHLDQQIREYDRRIQKLLKKYEPAASRLSQVQGVGPITTLAVLLAIGNPMRFAKSRDVGAYFGIVPRQDHSGARQPELRITKQGNSFVRRLLVQCAQYILGPFGKDSDLRRFGERIIAAGGKNAKKRAIVAVARKLAVLLHRLWVTGEKYEPLRQAQRITAAQAA